MATRDQIFNGKLPVWQPQKNQGYRFNIDSLLLAGFVLRTLKSTSSLCELGSGSAVIGLALLYHRTGLSYHGIERQAELVALSRRSLEEAGYDERAKVSEGDLRELELSPKSVDVVLFNPPYFKAGSGRSSNIPGRREAREALHGDIKDFFEVASRLLRDDGQIFAVLRPERRCEAEQLVKELQLSVNEVCEVRTVAQGKHQLDLYRLSKQGQGTEPQLTSLYLHKEKGSREYTTPVNDFLAGRSSALSADAFCTKPQ